MDRDLGAPSLVPPEALRALPGFLRAALSGTTPGPRLETRSKSWSKTPGIKSISPRAPAKFHQVRGAQGKGVSWETWGGRGHCGSSDSRRRRKTEGAGPGTLEKNKEAGGRRAGVKPAASGRASRAGGAGAAKEADGEGPAGRGREGG